MPDEQSDKMVKLLEEIRDLTKDRNEKLEAMLETSRQGHEDARKRYEDTLQRQKEAQQHAVARRHRFFCVLIPLLLLAIGFVAYLAFWVIPKSDQKDAERWLEQMRMMETNQISQPR
jgi:hypothetical protein